MAAAALRDAGLHPVVLAHDPLAQLLEPGRSARVLVPQAELEAARELLEIFEPIPPEVSADALRRGLGGTAWALVFLLGALIAPRLLPFWAAAAAVAWFLLRRARRRALEGPD